MVKNKDFDLKKESAAFSRVSKSRVLRKLMQNIGKESARSTVADKQYTARPMEAVKTGDGLNEKKFSANLRKIGKSKRTSKVVSRMKLASSKR